MFLVVDCALLVVDRVMFALVCYVLFVGVCSLVRVARYLYVLLFVACCGVYLMVCCFVCCMLFVDRCLVVVVCCVLIAFCCLLFLVCCLLFVFVFVC